MKYEAKQAKTSETIELRCKVNGTMAEKVKLIVFEDGSDEQFLKLIKEFKNLIFTYDMWNKPDGSELTHQNGSDHSKNMKNPCRLHNRNHGWTDCWQNPKNSNNNQQ
jgi:hypothetical protein